MSLAPALDSSVLFAEHVPRLDASQKLEVNSGDIGLAGEGVKIVSSVFFMLLAEGVLVYGNCAVNPDPDERQLADIALASAQATRSFGVDPEVAMVSYSPGGSGSGRRGRRTRACYQRAVSPDLTVEGSIQYDAAVNASIATSKHPGSEVSSRVEMVRCCAASCFTRSH